jgi:hypothetical protein
MQDLNSTKVCLMSLNQNMKYLLSNIAKACGSVEDRQLYTVLATAWKNRDIGVRLPFNL